MFEDWHILNRNKLNNMPAEGEEVFFCIAETREGPYTVVKRMRTKRATILDLLNIHPNWHILWQPLPASPQPPNVPVCELEG